MIRALALGGLLLLGGCSLSRMGTRVMEAQARHQGLEERFVASDTARVRYWKGGTGPPLLVLHGFGGDGLSTWRPNLASLMTERTVIVPDLPWFGQSTSVLYPGLLAVARAMLDLLDSEGIARTDAMGVSYGGFVLTAMETLRPGIFDGVVIVDSPGPVFGTSDVDALCRRFEVAHPEDIFLVDEPADVQRLFDLTLHHQRRLPRFLLRDLQRQVFTANREEQRLLMRDLATHDGRATQLSGWQAPLIVWGQYDTVFPLASGEALASLLGAELVVIPETAHGPSTEDPAAFNAALLQWLRERDAAP
jgi:pimeloyl-ACP methyl ester carboxylesterase